MSYKLQVTTYSTSYYVLLQVTTLSYNLQVAAAADTVRRGQHHRAAGEQRAADLQVTSYKLQATSYKLQVTSYKLQVPIVELGPGGRLDP